MMLNENIPPVSPGIEKIYQKKTQLEHILLRPDTYIGSTEAETEHMYVLDEANKKLVNRKITFVAGLYKIFDEIIVNAADNKQRDNSMNIMKVDIDEATGTVSVYNNGRGIPIQMHKEHGIYVPELIFGHLLTSSNYDDKQKKTTGGRNGYGAKLTNIFSQEFTVETADSKTGLYFKQTFNDNMSRKTKPKITKYDKPDWTRITFRPDFSKFGMDGFDQDHLDLFKKRVYDIAGTSDKGLKVFLNKERVKCNTFKEYVKLHFNEDSSTPLIYFKPNDRWELMVGVSDGSFKQVSFVNSICTIKGGKHVTNITDQVTKALGDHIAKKHKGVPLKAAHIKNHLFVFVNCLIENPAFDSQTKDTLTTNKQKFGSKCDLDDSFMKQVIKSGIVENVLSWAKFKQNKDMKKNDGKKKNRLSGIPKLDDANNAGGRHAQDCTLILTEGDSAKALAVSGLSVVGRDNYGVYPLKGKMLNVREATHKSIMGNVEITQLKQIIGLQQGKVYEDTKSLRYGHVMIMTDQDHDGSHIKGLVINLFATFWPSLLKIPGFLVEFITPIVKVTKGKKEQSFYTLPEYEEWKKENNEGKGWKIKYYKGLGTSTAKEAKEYFTQLDRHKIEFVWEGKEDDEAIDLAFSKKRAADRKKWMEDIEPNTYLDMDIDKLGLSDFVNKELILFSMSSNIRAIPHMMDGLKPGQRKIMYACFKRKLVKEIKVAQLAGYVSEHAAYHHGEASLTSTIVNLAQNYCGANNINLLMPNGQFGTRHNAGKDAASARYIFTNMSPVTRAIFPETDDNLLANLVDDGQVIEPAWYAPIIPMVLANGSSGIGTGWSSNIPNYNPRDLVQNIKLLLQNEEPEELVPWYKGFTGTIEKGSSSSYNVAGKVDKHPDGVTFRIEELPIGKDTHDYKLFLETLIESGVLKDFKEYHSDNTVSFVITAASEEKAAELDLDLYKNLKLTSSIAISNMVLFNTENKLKKYETANEILQEFFAHRLKLYVSRKEYLEDKINAELNKVSNKVRFILDVISDKLKIRNVKKAVIMEQLEKAGFDRIYKKKAEKSTDDDDEDEKEEEELSADDLSKGYDYLLSMPLWNLTMEKVDALKAEKAAKEEELAVLQATSPESMWETDLDNFLEKLEDHEAAEAMSAKEDAALINKVKRSKAKKAKAMKDDDDWAPSKPKPSKKPAARPKTAPKQTTLNVLQERSKTAQKPPAKKLARSKANAIEKEDVEDISDFEPSDNEDAYVASSRPSRANKNSAVNYAVDNSEEEDMDSESEEEEFMSLADRMAAKNKSIGSSLSSMGFTSNKAVPKAKAVVKAKAAPQKQVSESEEEEDDAFQDNDDSENYEPSPVKTKKKAPAKASKSVASKKAPAAKVNKRKKSSPAKKSNPVSPPSPLSCSPAPKKARAAPKAKPIGAQKAELTSKLGAKKAPTKKAPTKKAPARKAATTKAAAKKYTEDSDFSENDVKQSDEESSEDIEVVKKTPRPARARKTISYIESESESEFESEEDDDDSDY